MFTELFPLTAALVTLLGTSAVGLRRRLRLQMKSARFMGQALGSLEDSPEFSHPQTSTPSTGTGRLNK